jgi:large subunit ribosomal protein L9
MKVILRDDVKALGRAGDVVSVSAGYARNFLWPKELAVQATPENLKRREQEVSGKKFKERRALKDTQYLAERLAAQPVTITAQTGEGGKLFGSVTTADIEQALAALGIEIDKRKLELAEPIKMVGSYEVAVKLPHEVTAKVTVVVAAKAEHKPKAESAPAEPALPKAEPAVDDEIPEPPAPPLE